MLQDFIRKDAFAYTELTEDIPTRGSNFYLTDRGTTKCLLKIFLALKAPMVIKKMVSFSPNRVALESTLGLFITETCRHPFISLIQDRPADRVLFYSNLPMENSHSSIFVLLPQLKTNPTGPRRKQSIKISSPSWKQV